jgi:hypothetical protein
MKWRMISSVKAWERVNNKIFQNAMDSKRGVEEIQKVDHLKKGPVSQVGEGVK